MASTAGKKDFQRLPTDVIPVNYCLELTPDLQAFTFAGRLRITVNVKNVTKQIKLNAADLEIAGAQFKKTLNDDNRMVAKATLCEEKEEVTFDFDGDLPQGEGYLEMEYKGVLNGDMKGFYRTRYTTNWGEERYAATTQFEPTDARRALPCWDEPAHKATFDVSLVVPHDRVALSNMNAIKDARISSNQRKVTFARTPKMSTYLLAFIVGEFDYVEDRDSNGVLIRVYTPMAKSEQGEFALDVAKKTLPFYHNYFDVKYPLPKMDLITIPDFSAGAMENWGLVTYRERLLLVDPKDTSLQSKQLVALVVGHELAHQWFGNLVTMEWWTHLWLNEGFATFIEYLCVDHCLGPEYDIWTQFNSQTYSPALKGDALANSHPIEVPVGHPDEVEEIFDLISYSKGASVIRMLHDWVGDENFRKGMKMYLTKYTLCNTQTEDLWRCLGEASGQPVDSVMSTWTKQMGYPVLDVQRRQDGGDTVLTLSQKKFCADGDTTGSEDYMWQVPVNVKVQGKEGVEKFLLDKKEMEYRLKGVGSSSWIKVNPEQKGFYRVHYSPDMLAALTQAIPSLPPSDRLGLLDEAFALAKAGVMGTDEALKLLVGYRSEENYTVWENLAGHIADLNRLLSNTDFHDKFKKFAVGLFQNVVDCLGWEPKEGEKPLDSMLRGLVLSAHGTNGNQVTLDKAAEKFKDHCECCAKRDSSSIPADLRGVVYQLAMRQGGMETFDKIFELSEGTDHQEEKVRLYRALGQTDKEEVLSKCHEYSLSDKVRAADSWALLVSASMASRTGREKTWAFIKANIGELKKRLGGAFLLSRVLEICTGSFAKEEVAKEVEEFFKEGGPNHIPTADRALKQSCESIRNNSKWLARDRDAIKSFLDSQA